MLARNDMSSSQYIPDRGDVVWVVLDPRVGHEQSGRRPAIVLSKRQLTEHTRLAVICPITSKVKGLSFELRIKTEKIDGAILPIHVRSIDAVARKVTFVEKAPEEILLKATRAVELIVN